MKGTWQTTDGGGQGGAALLVVVIAAVVAAAAAGPVVRAVGEVLRIVFIVVVSLVGLGVAGAAVALVLARRARHNAPPWAAQVLPPARPRQQPVAQPQPQQALPAPSVHHHYGHSLVLPDTVSGEDLAKLFRKQGD